MNSRKEHVLKSLDKRVAFYRFQLVWAFILGLFAGAVVLCGHSTAFAWILPDRQQIWIKILLYFFIAVTGIVTGSAYRHRIRHLLEHRNRIIMNARTDVVFQRPVREHAINEIQVLFGILFLFAVVVTGIRYPTPDLPRLLDNGGIQLASVVVYFVLCWVPAGLERKNYFMPFNPIQSFVEEQQKQAKQFHSRGRASRNHQAA